MNIVVAMLVAVVKATLVCLIYSKLNPTSYKTDLRSKFAFATTPVWECCLCSPRHPTNWQHNSAKCVQKRLCRDFGAFSNGKVSPKGQNKCPGWCNFRGATLTNRTLGQMWGRSGFKNCAPHPKRWPLVPNGTHNAYKLLWFGAPRNLLRQHRENLHPDPPIQAKHESQNLSTETPPRHGGGHRGTYGTCAIG